jgi:hypothetical protein
MKEPTFEKSLKFILFIFYQIIFYTFRNGLIIQRFSKSCQEKV